MKNNRYLKYLGLAAVALLLAGATSTSQAQNITNTFPVGANIANFTMPGWIYWYNVPGGNTPMTCAIGINAEGNDPTLGSLEMDCPWLTAGWTQNIMLFFGANNATYAGQYQWNLLPYTNVEFKVYVPAGVPADANGNFAPIEVYFMYNSGWNIQYLGTVVVPAAAQSGWVTMNCPINQATPNLANACGLAFGVIAWGTDNNNGYPAYVNYTNYIDDISIDYNSAWVAPQPKLANPVTAIIGLNETCPSSADSGDRQQICTAHATGYSFVGQPKVTYSWTVKSWPNIVTANQWQSHFFIVGGPSSSSDLTADGGPGLYDQAPDWNLANCIFIAVQQDTDGTGYINFRCKTNEPGGNGMIWNTSTNPAVNTNGWPVESLCFFRASKPVGNWSVTFQGTSVTITNPDNISTNFTLDAGFAALFADPVSLCLGAQANNANGGGQTVVYGNFSVTGNATPFSDDFTSDPALNTNYWRDLSGDPTGDNLVPPGSVCWVTWGLPDNGYGLEATPALPATAIQWQTPNNLTSFISGTTRQALIPSSAVGANQGYFRLIHRNYTQLQILLPGQTNAPNTVLGYVGTPTTSYSAYDTIAVTVNACDNTWSIVNTSGDTIVLTSPDSQFFVLNNPVNLPLTGGTASFSVTFTGDGSSAITASDSTDGSKTPATTPTLTY